MRRILTILLFISIGGVANGQSSITICHSPAAKKFYNFSITDFAFQQLHPIPERTAFRYGKGRLKQLRTEDFKTAWIYEILTDTPSDKYIFMFHDEYGMTSNMKEAAEKIYKELEDTNVILVDMYDSKIARDHQQLNQLLGKVTWVRTSNIIMSLLNEVGENAQIVTLGYSVGGGWALEASMLAYKKSVGTVMYYGTPIMVQDILRNIQGPVLGFFSSEDPWITEQLISDFGQKMKEENRVFMPKFVDASHGFATPGSTIQNPAVAEKTHIESLEFIKSRLR